jgi:hypothetical protein
MPESYNEDVNYSTYGISIYAEITKFLYETPGIYNTTKSYLFKSLNMSGNKKFKSDQSSAKLFCSGVPVNNNRLAAGKAFNSLQKACHVIYNQYSIVHRQHHG